jgi:hypothetical protein
VHGTSLEVDSMAPSISFIKQNKSTEVWIPPLCLRL